MYFEAFTIESLNKRKNLTQACVVCKARHQKCSGEQPCDYCSIKGQVCEYNSQNKRGPKIRPKSNTKPSSLVCSSLQVQSVSLKNEGSLWQENERAKYIDSFFEMRNWWSLMLDANSIKNPNDIVSQIQNIIIGAHISRFHSNHERAEELSNHAQNMLKQTKENNTASFDHAIAGMLLSDFDPNHGDSWLCLAWNQVKHLPRTTPRQLRLFLFIRMLYLGFCTTNTTTKQERFVEMFNLMCSQPQAQLQDVAFALLLKTINSMFFNISWSDFQYLDNLKDIQFSADTLTRIMQDINMVQWIIKCNYKIFGAEFKFWFDSIKPMILWKMGNIDAAISETIYYLQEFKNLGAQRIFLNDLVSNSEPFLILKEAGMWTHLKEAAATNQQELYSYLVDYFSESTFPSSPPMLTLENNDVDSLFYPYNVI